MNFKPNILPFLLCLIFLLGCREQAAPTIPTLPPVDTVAPATNPPPTETAEPTTEPAATAVSQNTPIPENTSEPSPVGNEWPEPSSPLANLSREVVTQAQRDTAVTLDQNLPPDRDDVQLAISYLGVTPPFDTPALVEEPLRVGTRQQIFVSNNATNETSNPFFELKHVSDHAYFWFDSTGGYTEPTESELLSMGSSFDEIYEQVTFYFGSEDTPGIDGDPLVHIVNAAPQTLCGNDSCGILGYVASSNFLPNEVYPTSNEREMFVMNASFFGGVTYLDVLAHEFRHMIEDNYDANDTDWEVEGSAMLAEDLLGYSSDPISRGNLFLSSPDQQLNRWTDGNSIPYYGQGYVLNRYIFNRLGEDLYREFAKSPLPGFLAIDDIAEQNGLGFTGLELWQDWQAALAIHSEPNAPELYALRDGLNTAVSESVNSFPYTTNTTVSQFAADYYKLFGDGTVTINFTGSNHVPLLEVQPASGNSMWLANRANYSHVRLTRDFDLSQVEAATLEYAVYYDIEYSYDFAYLSISTDDGQTWQGLTADNMQGTEIADDPSDVAYTDRFYTGRDSGWLMETADLTPYVGQTVQIRYEYVTDPILTFGGFAIDNIAIPEIGYYDDAETDTGWIAEGFARATGYVPQQWYIQLIRYEKEAPIVAMLELSEDNTLTIDVPLNSSGGGRPILIISATAPMTLEPAYYQLEVVESE